VKFVHISSFRGKHAEAQHFVFLARTHHAHHVVTLDCAVHNAEQDNDALIAVVPRVEDECFERSRHISLRGREPVDNGFENRVNAHARFGRNWQGFGAVKADAFFDFGLHAVNLGAGQVDFIEHRHYFVVVIQSKVDVGKRLRFHALSGVNHQQRTFAGRQGA